MLSLFALLSYIRKFKYILFALTAIMTLSEYSVLQIENQLEILRKQSVYLCSRRSGDYIFFLYQIDEFYIEVTYSHSNNKLINLFSFQSPLLLEPYMDKIRLKHMF